MQHRPPWQSLLAGFPCEFTAGDGALRRRSSPASSTSRAERRAGGVWGEFWIFGTPSRNRIPCSKNRLFWHPRVAIVA